MIGACNMAFTVQSHLLKWLSTTGALMALATASDAGSGRLLHSGCRPRAMGETAGAIGVSIAAIVVPLLCLLALVVVFILVGRRMGRMIFREGT